MKIKEEYKILIHQGGAVKSLRMLEHAKEHHNKTEIDYTSFQED